MHYLFLILMSIFIGSAPLEGMNDPNLNFNKKMEITSDNSNFYLADKAKKYCTLKDSAYVFKPPFDDDEIVKDDNGDHYRLPPYMVKQISKISKSDFDVIGKNKASNQNSYLYVLNEDKRPKKEFKVNVNTFTLNPLYIQDYFEYDDEKFNFNKSYNENHELIKVNGDYFFLTKKDKNDFFKNDNNSNYQWKNELEGINIKNYFNQIGKTKDSLPIFFYMRNEQQLNKKVNIGSQNNDQKITITYYNVGQGNCVLMENQTQKQAVLVDCGTSEWGATNERPEKKPSIELEKVIKDIQKKFQEATQSLVIISHDDADHYNLIPAIFAPADNQSNENFKGTQPTVIIGSELKNFKVSESKTQPQIVKNYPNLNKWLSKVAVNTIEKSATKDRVQELQGFLKDYPWIHPIVAVKNEKNSNASSIVVKAFSGLCSALLPGDADKDTEGGLLGISNNVHMPELKTTILLSSHHGADSEGSNSITWIKGANPKAVIISAGYNRGYGHPRCRIIDRYINNAENLGVMTTKHPLTCGYHEFVDAAKRDEPLTKNERTTEFTGAQSIFNTFDQDKITVNFNGDNTFTLNGKKVSEVQHSVLLEKQKCN